MKSEMKSTSVDRTFPCPVCGNILRKNEKTETCMYCGKKEKAEFLCPEGHFLCEACRLSGPQEIILRTCEHSSETNPYELASLIMKHPSFNPHGIEHHLLVGPVLLAACKNSGLEIPLRKIKTAMKRVKDIPYGSCGSRGGCGASESAGAGVSLITGASFTSREERSLALSATADSLKAIARIGGPRCCKQSVFASIEQGLESIKGKYPTPETNSFICPFADEIEDCQKKKCPYYG